MSPSFPHSEDTSASLALIMAVAEEMDVYPTELPEKLHEVIDPDALDALFARGNTTNGSVTITFCGYLVTITAKKHVSVEKE